MNIIDKIKCLFGFHSWLYDSEDGLGNRCCRRCGKWEHWLGGYGGSEIGSWNPGWSEY